MTALFYLGCPEARWLAQTDVPLFVSRRTLAPRKKLPVATCRWACDSGGFTEISMFGEWRTSAAEYANDVMRFQSFVGNLDWAAPQDWMCEPDMIRKTGLSIVEHQQRTVVSLLELRTIAPGVHWIPVIQGWRLADYLRCVELYAAAGIDLRAEPTVGIGSVCRRQDTNEAASLVREVAALGIRLHGFGFKAAGLCRVGDLMASADSMAWSARARRISREGGTTGLGCTHGTCSNCLKWALHWRRKLLASVDAALAESAKQTTIFDWIA